MLCGQPVVQVQIFLCSPIIVFYLVLTLQVVLKAGDILYIPQHWWHHVRSFDCPNIAISLWFHPFAEKEDSEDLTPEDESEDVRISAQQIIIIVVYKNTV